MKVKVIKRFKDKHTGKKYKVNDILEISEERFEEILKVGKLVKKVSEVAEDAAEEKPKGRNKKEEK